jgi:hypothetical protein
MVARTEKLRPIAWAPIQRALTCGAYGREMHPRTDQACSSQGAMMVSIVDARLESVDEWTQNRTKIGVLNAHAQRTQQASMSIADGL